MHDRVRRQLEPVDAAGYEYLGVDAREGCERAERAGAQIEEPLGKLRVRACPDQAGKLVAWAQAWPERTWAVEGARGLGRLLAQQLVAAGERVLDVLMRGISTRQYAEVLPEMASTCGVLKKGPRGMTSMVPMPTERSV